MRIRLRSHSCSDLIAISCSLKPLIGRDKTFCIMDSRSSGVADKKLSAPTSFAILSTCAANQWYSGTQPLSADAAKETSSLRSSRPCCVRSCPNKAPMKLTKVLVSCVSRGSSLSGPGTCLAARTRARYRRMDGRLAPNPVTSKPAAPIARNFRRDNMRAIIVNLVAFFQALHPQGDAPLFCINPHAKNSATSPGYRTAMDFFRHQSPHEQAFATHTLHFRDRYFQNLAHIAHSGGKICLDYFHADRTQ